MPATSAPKSRRTPVDSARDRLLAAAERLFYAEGVGAVGIDRVIAEADVAKMSLYHHFKSKDDLVAAWLRRRDAEWFGWFIRAVNRSAKTPAARPLAIFDALGQWFRKPGFRGCAFINTCGETADRSPTITAICREHTARLASLIKDWCVEAGLRDPEAVASGLSLLVEGTIVWASMHSDPKVAGRARNAAKLLVGS